MRMKKKEEVINNEQEKEEEENIDNKEEEKENEDKGEEKEELKEEEVKGEEVKDEVKDDIGAHKDYSFDVEGNQIKAIWSEKDGNININFNKNAFPGNLVLHWGLFKDYPITCWNHPDKENYPSNTKEFDGFALQTEFSGENMNINLPKNGYKGISFVFYNPDSDVWYNNKRKDFQIEF